MPSIYNPSPGADSVIASAKKTVAEIVNNSEALQEDDQLFLNVDANEISLVLVYLKPSSATATPDFAYDFSMPAGGEFRFITTGIIGALASAAVMPQSITAQTHENLGTGANLNQFIIGIYKGGGTAGQLKLRWAQDVATVEDTQIDAGSIMVKIK